LPPSSGTIGRRAVRSGSAHPGAHAAAHTTALAAAASAALTAALTAAAVAGVAAQPLPVATSRASLAFAGPGTLMSHDCLLMTSDGP